MSENTSQTTIASTGQDTEPTVGSGNVPMWLMMLPLLLAFWGAMYFDWHGGWFNSSVHAPYTSVAELTMLQPSTGGDRILIRGKLVYDQVCALCHGVDGAGKPAQAPTFINADWVISENPAQLIRIPLQGISGPIIVNGEEWNLAMPAMGASLPDDDLAAVLSYMRGAWGNQASPITPEQVQEVREATKSRTQPWTATELQAVQ